MAQVYRLTHGSVQDRFHKSTGKIQIFGGAYANGKTTAMAIKALRIAQNYPGSNGLLARATYPKLRDTLQKVFMSWCPPDWIKKKPTQDDNTCYLHNGSVINFRYIAQRGKTGVDGQTTSNLLSATYDWIGVDQVEDPEITEKDFLDLLGRLRGQTPYRPPDNLDDPAMPSTGPRWMMLACNPTANWFFKKVVQPYIIWRDRGLKTDGLMVDQASGLPIVELFESSIYDNVANLPEDYIATQESVYRGQMRERFLLGKWAAFEGLVHPDFDTNTHVLTREQAINHILECRKRHVRLRVIEGYDFGIASPSCYGFGIIDDYGRVILLDGYHRAEFAYHEQPDAIREIRRNWLTYGLEPHEPIHADPAIFKRQVVAEYKSTGERLSELFRKAGILMRPGGNDIMSGIAKINSYLNGTHDIPHLLTGKRPGPLFYVCAELEWFTDEIHSYYWKRNPQGQTIDIPIDNNDHAMNMTKYMLSRLPEPSDIVLPKSAMPPGWMRWQEVDENRMRV